MALGLATERPSRTVLPRTRPAHSPERVRLSLDCVAAIRASALTDEHLAGSPPLSAWSRQQRTVCLWVQCQWPLSHIHTRPQYGHCSAVPIHHDPACLLALLCAVLLVNTDHTRISVRGSLVFAPHRWWRYLGAHDAVTFLLKHGQACVETPLCNSDGSLGPRSLISLPPPPPGSKHGQPVESCSEARSTLKPSTLK